MEAAAHTLLQAPVGTHLLQAWGLLHRTQALPPDTLQSALLVGVPHTMWVGTQGMHHPSEQSPLVLELLGGTHLAAGVGTQAWGVDPGSPLGAGGTCQVGSGVWGGRRMGDEGRCRIHRGEWGGMGGQRPLQEGLRNQGGRHEGACPLGVRPCQVAWGAL